MEGCVYILANSCSERRRHLIGPMRTSAADVNLAEARPTPIKERTPTTSTPRRKFVIPAPAVPKTISLRVRERRGFIWVPRSKMAGGFSLDMASTEMDLLLYAEAHCTSFSGVRASHRHASGVGITRGVQG